MLALIAAPMSPTAMLMNAFNLSGLTAMIHLPRNILRILCQLLVPVKLARME